MGVLVQDNSLACSNRQATINMGYASSNSSSEPPLLANSIEDDAPWVVQKYGGTSVGKSLESIGSIVESYIKGDNKVAVVCSARSGVSKALGTTNLLLQASREALDPRLNPDSDKVTESVSGTATPYYPNRVGSGYFNNGSFNMSPADAAPPTSSKDLASSVASLRDLKLTSRSSSPSPFQPSTGSPTSSAFLPTSITSPSTNGSTPRAAVAVSQDELPSFHKTVDQLKKDHLAAARGAVKDESLLQELNEEIERDLEKLRSFLSAAQIIDEISARSQDSIIGIGEKLACKIVAASLRDRGIDSELVCLNHIVDSSISSGEEAAQASSSHDQGIAQLDQSFYDRLCVRLGERLRACGTRVPVITGYFGIVPGSLLSQIGRGYTDLCAALCAVGVQASELQVWKEVDGIFTADPRKVPTARMVPIITPDEAAELTYYGSEVIHPFTMEQVIRAKIPIRIKNVDNPSGEGTIIYPAQSSDMDSRRNSTDAAPGVGKTNVNDIVKMVDSVKMPTAVTIKDEIIVINIHSNRKTISHGFLARIFGTLDRAGVVVDLISTSEVHVSPSRDTSIPSYH